MTENQQISARVPADAAAGSPSSRADALPFWPALVDQASDVIFVVDTKGDLALLNRAGERLSGLAPDRAGGRTLADLVAPESLTAARDHVRAACEEGRTGIHPLDLLAGDGRRIPFEVSTARIGLDPDGSRPACLCIARDTSGRGRADEALRYSEQRFRLLVENAADGLMLVSAEGRIFFASRPAMRWLGYAPEEVVGRDLTDFVDPADRDRLSWALVEAVDLPAIAVHAEYRWRHPDGSRRLHEATLVSHLDHPSLNAIVINFRDVTDRRAAEAALHETEQLFRAVFESAYMGIARVGLDGRIVDVNRAVIEMSGYSHAEIVDRPVASFLHPDDTDATLHDFALLTSGQRPSSRAERRFRAKDGALFWVNVTAVLVRTSAGLPQFVLAVLENITDRKQAEVELRETNERLSGWVEALEQRTREIGLLSEMGDLLQACRSPQEACTVIVPTLAKLFPLSAGVLSVVAEGPTVMVDPIARWGTSQVPEAFSVDECWALRRGRAHVSASRSEGLLCRHLASLDGDASMCVPMMAHGQMLGVLSMMVPDAAELGDPRQRLVLTVGEHVALALANLKLEETLRRQSIRDPLTGLFNRRYMEESLEREMRRAVRNRSSVGIIMLDVDHFKPFNDAHGHDAGDALLRAIGGVLQRSIRAEDIACRYGGEEFTLILPEASLHEAAQRADAIRQAVKHLQVSHRRQELPPVTISAGVALYPDHGPTADAVLRAADTALYQAKGRGRDRVILNQMGGLFPESIVEFGRR